MNKPVISYAEYQVILKTDFVSFLQRAFHEINPHSQFLLAPYIEYLAAKLEECRQGKLRRLIINLPPRYLKSHCTSVAFVAWLLGHAPGTQVICASYGQDLADKLALDCRKLMLSGWYHSLFGTRLAADKLALSDYMTTAAGGRMSTSVGGVLTGRGADFIIIDDPLKPEDALSESKRTAVNNWYDSTLLSRLNNKMTGRIILIMQRLHQDDLVGHVLEQDDWEIVSFPAIAECDERHVFQTPLGEGHFMRREGEPLHAERETHAMLNATRERIGSYNFASQYQQTPTPVGGAMIKSDWLQYYDKAPPSYGSHIVQSWDTANKSTNLSDYSVCTTWAASDGRYYLLDVFRKRLNYPELKKAVTDLANRFRPKKILIEDKASGTALIQDLKSSGIYYIAAYEPPPGMDKTMRLHAQSDVFEQGKVCLPRQAPWLNDYRTELTGFPGSRYDDQVDSTSQALDYLKNTYSRSLEVWEKLAR